MVERRSGEVAVPLSAKKIFKRVVPTDMQTAVSLQLAMNTLIRPMFILPFNHVYYCVLVIIENFVVYPTQNGLWMMFELCLFRWDYTQLIGIRYAH